MRDCPLVSGVELLLLVCAGVGAGLAGSIAGLASLVSYPALLSAGLGPVQANVTNTVALVFSTLGSTLGSRAELRGQLPSVRRLAVAAVAGGAVGAGLLLLTSPEAFERIAPWLIAAASLAILLRQPQEGAHREGALGGPALTGGVFLVGIYGGYFGAAAGVVLLALLLAGTRDTLARTNALKNAVLGIANATAALAFCLLADVRLGDRRAARRRPAGRRPARPGRRAARRRARAADADRHRRSPPRRQARARRLPLRPGGRRSPRAILTRLWITVYNCGT